MKHGGLMDILYSILYVASALNNYNYIYYMALHSTIIVMKTHVDCVIINFGVSTLSFDVLG